MESGFFCATDSRLSQVTLDPYLLILSFKLETLDDDTATGGEEDLEEVLNSMGFEPLADPAMEETV